MWLPRTAQPGSASGPGPGPLSCQCRPGRPLRDSELQLRTRMPAALISVPKHPGVLPNPFSSGEFFRRLHRRFPARAPASRQGTHWQAFQLGGRLSLNHWHSPASTGDRDPTRRLLFLPCQVWELRCAPRRGAAVLPLRVSRLPAGSESLKPCLAGPRTRLRPTGPGHALALLQNQTYQPPVPSVSCNIFGATRSLPDHGHTRTL